MKSELLSFGVLCILCALLSGCATIPPATDTPISLPVSFEKTWYRPKLARPGIQVMTDTGTVTVGTDGVAFIGKKGTTEISYEKIQHLDYRKVGTDFINNWVTIKYRDGDRESYALFSGGKALGWDSIGEAAQIFQCLRFALEQKGLASVVEQ